MVRQINQILVARNFGRLFTTTVAFQAHEGQRAIEFAKKLFKLINEEYGQEQPANGIEFAS
jgi:hypothetical protein